MDGNAAKQLRSDDHVGPNDYVPTVEAYEELQRAFTYFNRELFAGDLPPGLITLRVFGKRTRNHFEPARFIHADGATKVDELAVNPMYWAVMSAERVLSTIVHMMVTQWQFHSGKSHPRRGYFDREWAAKMKAVGLYPSHTCAPGGREIGEGIGEYAIADGPFERAARALVESGWRLSWLDRNTERFIEPLSLPHVEPAPPPAPVVATAAAEPQAPAAIAAPTPARTGPPASLRPLTPAPSEAVAMDLIKNDRVNRTNRQRYTCPTCNCNVWGKPGLELACRKCDASMETSGVPPRTPNSSEEE